MPVIPSLGQGKQDDQDFKASGLCEILFVLYVCGYFDCMYVYTSYVCLLTMKVKRRSQIVTGSCESPCGCWESNLDPLEEHPVLLTTESSLQLSYRLYLKTNKPWHIMTIMLTTTTTTKRKGDLSFQRVGRALRELAGVQL